MNIIFPIVGLERFIPKEELFPLVQSLPDGAEVVLLYDNANTYDRYSIQAWMELMVNGERKKTQVGFVSSDFAPMIRANFPHNNTLTAYVVHPDTGFPDEVCFEVEMELEQLVLPPMPIRIHLEPIANIPLPMTCPERQMMWRDIMDYSQTQITPEGVLALARRSASLFGHGLSGDERTAYTLLSTMLAYVHGLWTDLSDAIVVQRLELDGLHREAFRTPEQCAHIMDEEMQAYKQSLNAFFDQYTAVLTSGLTTREREIDTHLQWLKDLPDNLYAWLNDKPTFASKLYYERFSMDELYAIYLHILCLDWLRAKGKRKLVVDDSLQQRIDNFAYWHPYATTREKRLAVQQMQDALSSKGKYPVADLAKAIKRLQGKQIIACGTIFVNFTSAINALLDTDIKSNSLAKHFRR
ncbi:MAG: hypothetical protein MJZ55_04815 [Paludibacteraceae bacterium]|nr:hypothetical protein [Paludibacteraceae bacterium]